MAAAGVGVDIVEVARMEAVIAKTPRFVSRCFSLGEQELAARSPRPAGFYAGRFAGHEAVLKALGCGLGQGVGRRDVSILEDELGRPQVVLSGGALLRAQALGVTEVALSLSLTETLAVANALALTEETRPKRPEQEEGAGAVVARSFKEARSIVDELEWLQEEGVHAAMGRPRGALEEDAHETSA